MNNRRRYTRREMLTLSAGTLLTLGLWPGALRAEGTGNSGNFRFVVVNDIHNMTEDRCGPWLERVLAKIKAGPQPEFCLLAGDASDHGTVAEFTPVKEAFAQLAVPHYTVIGNHDYLKQTDRSDYEKALPGRLNYQFEHRGWNFVGLNTTEGMKASKTTIHADTLQWLDDNLRKLDKKSPLVVFTHFPLGENVSNRPVNADAVLERLRDHNLQYVFSGHFHAATERQAGATTLVTNRCCSITRPNHDNSKDKGFFLCEAKEGKVSREFVKVDTSGLAEPATPDKPAKKQPSK